MINCEVSLRELPDSEDTVRLLPLLLDSDRVDMLDLEDRPDSDPDADLDPTDLVVFSVFDDRPDFAVRLELDVRSDLEEMPDTSERSDLDDNSEMEDTLVLEVIPDTVDRAVVDLFCSGSGCGWIVITLEDTFLTTMTAKICFESQSCLKNSHCMESLTPVNVWVYC